VVFMRCKKAITTFMIVELILGTMAFIAIASFGFDILAPRYDRNKEFAKGVYGKLEVAMDDLDKTGGASFNIVDVPIDYKSAVFLVLFEDEKVKFIDEYPVDIRGSSFSTYVERTTFASLMVQGGGAYVANDIMKGAKNIADRRRLLSFTKEVDDVITKKALQNTEDFLFSVRARSMVKNLHTRLYNKVGTAGGMTVAEAAESGTKQMMDDLIKQTAGKSADEKMTILRGLVKKTLNGVDDAADLHSVLGNFNSVDSFLNSAQGFGDINAVNALDSLVPESIIATQADDVAKGLFKGDKLKMARFRESYSRKIFGQFVDSADQQEAIRKMIKEIDPGVSAGKVTKAFKGVGAVDDAARIAAIKSIKNTLPPKAVSGIVGKATGQAADDLLLKAMAAARSAVKSSPTIEEGGEIVSKIVAKRIKDAKIFGVINKKLVKLVPKMIGRAVGYTVTAFFAVVDYEETEAAAKQAKAEYLVNVHDDEVSKNKWVSSKILKQKKGGDRLCVCYVDSLYEKNYCPYCVEAEDIESEGDQDYWTSCSEIYLTKKEGQIKIYNNMKEGCKSSVAFTNTECNSSSERLTELVDSGDFFDELGGVVSAAATGVASNAIGVGIAVGVCAFVFFFTAGTGVAPCAAAAITILASTGGAVSGAMEDVEFGCLDGDIYMGHTGDFRTAVDSIIHSEAIVEIKHNTAKK
jgi:hypothetical protein